MKRRIMAIIAWVAVCFLAFVVMVYLTGEFGSAPS